MADVHARDVGGSFSSLADATIQVYLDDAALRLNEDAFGAAYDAAHCYLAMHMLASGAYGTSSGPITSATAGGISVGFGASGGATGGLSSTRWGQLYEELATSLGLYGMSVIVGTDLYE